MGPSHYFPSPSRVSSLCSQVPSQVPSKGRQIRQVPSQVPSQGSQVQVKSQVMSLQVQVLNKSLWTFCDPSVRDLTMKLGRKCDCVLPSYASGHSFEVIVVLSVNAMRSTHLHASHHNDSTTAVALPQQTTDIAVLWCYSHCEVTTLFSSHVHVPCNCSGFMVREPARYYKAWQF